MMFPFPASRSNRSHREALALVFVLTLGLPAVPAVAAVPAVPASAARLVTIDIVTVNDFHGRLEALPPAPGAAVLGGMVQAYEEANPNTLFVAAGDSVGGSTFPSFIADDKPTLDALNAMGLDVSALGNHEFDKGRDDLDSRIVPDSDFPYLGANVYEKGTQTPAYDEYAIKKVRGVSVGFIGAVTENTPTSVSPEAVDTLDFGPIVPAVNRVADQLSDGDNRNGEADVLILLVHEGASNGDITSATDASPFGQIATGVNGNVDAIVSGHTHETYNHQIAPTGSTVTRPVIQAGHHGEKFGHLSMTVDKATGDIANITSEVLPLADAFAPDPVVEQIVADAVAASEVAGAVRLGEITADLNRAYEADGETRSSSGESTLGNFVADTQLWATKNAGSQLALVAPGGLRTDLRFASSGTAGDADGIVTYREAADVQPFADTLVAMDLTAEQLDSVLEEQWQPTRLRKLGLSESIKYTYDPTAEAGDHVDAIYVNGELIQTDQSYRVTVGSFLAAGTGGFSTFAAGTNRQDTGKVDLEGMVDYFEEFGRVSPDFAQRSIGVIMTPTPAGGFVAGDTVTVNLSSLLFSTNEPNAGTVELSLGDTVLGSSVIDPAVVDSTDEVGRASVSFVVPDGLFGPQMLSVSIAETGTAMDVPIQLAAT